MPHMDVYMKDNVCVAFHRSDKLDNPEPVTVEHDCMDVYYLANYTDYVGWELEDIQDLHDEFMRCHAE